MMSYTHTAHDADAGLPYDREAEQEDMEPADYSEPFQDAPEVDASAYPYHLPGGKRLELEGDDEPPSCCGLWNCRDCRPEPARTAAGESFAELAAYFAARDRRQDEEN